MITNSNPSYNATDTILSQQFHNNTKFIGFYYFLFEFITHITLLFSIQNLTPQLCPEIVMKMLYLLLKLFFLKLCLYNNKNKVTKMSQIIIL